MATARTGDLVNAAVAHGWGVAAFNIITLEHAEAVIAGAEAAGTPVILQISENAVAFHRGRLCPLAGAAQAIAHAAAVPVALHLDHVEDIDLLDAALDAGMTSAMFDAAALPYAVNVARTRAAVEWAHDHGVWLEAELGYVGGKESQPVSAHAPGVRTDPREAADFVAATGIDALAVAVGTSHAMRTRSADVDLDLIERLREAVTVPLVLHGSSGVPDDQLRAAVARGIVKVNIGTALNRAMTTRVREVLDTDLDLVDPRKYLAPARDAMSSTAEALIRVVTGR